MVTKFLLKTDAEAFCRELEHNYGVGVYYHIYKGHRHYCVQHNDMSATDQQHDADYAAKNVK